MTVASIGQSMILCCLPPLVALVSLPVRQRETGSRFADWGPVLFDMTNYFDRFLPTRSALFDEEDSGDHKCSREIGLKNGAVAA